MDLKNKRFIHLVTKIYIVQQTNSSYKQMSRTLRQYCKIKYQHKFKTFKTLRLWKTLGDFLRTYRETNWFCHVAHSLRTFYLFAQLTNAQGIDFDQSSSRKLCARSCRWNQQHISWSITNARTLYTTVCLTQVTTTSGWWVFFVFSPWSTIRRSWRASCRTSHWLVWLLWQNWRNTCRRDMCGWCVVDFTMWTALRAQRRRCL